MSLGFNQARPARTTSLQGGVNGSIIYRAPRNRTLSSPRVVSQLAASPPTPAVHRVKERTSDGAQWEATQWVYGVAGCDLVDSEQEQVAVTGDRVLLVYPTKRDSETGRISMRLKRVHPITAQLSHHWVVVHDPDAVPAHRVVNFSLVP